jgi:hypothetical protein
MSELNIFKAVIRVEYEDAKGRTKYKKENYIVEGVSPTDVETKIAKRLEGADYELIGVTLTNIIEIIK